MRFSYLRFAIPVTLAIAAILAWPVLALWDQVICDAVIAAGIIALANTLFAGISFEFAIDKSNQIFLGTVFGGMIVRMVITMAAFFILLSKGYNGRALALALMAFYVTYMILEIVYTIRELSRRRVRIPRESRRPQSAQLRRAAVPHSSSR